MKAPLFIILKNPRTNRTNEGPLRAKSHKTDDIARPCKARSRKSENNPTIQARSDRKITLEKFYIYNCEYKILFRI